MLMHEVYLQYVLESGPRASPCSSSHSLPVARAIATRMRLDSISTAARVAHTRMKCVHSKVLGCVHPCWLWIVTAHPYPTCVSLHDLVPHGRGVGEDSEVRDIQTRQRASHRVVSMQAWT